MTRYALNGVEKRCVLKGGCKEIARICIRDDYVLVTDPLSIRRADTMNVDK